jgi:hypothetical protein
MQIRPRLGPSVVSPADVAHQVFRCTPEMMNRLPAQLRLAIVHHVRPDFTAEKAIALIDSGEESAVLEPHDAFLASIGQDY